MALIPRFSLSAATFDVFHVKGCVLATLDLRDGALELIVLGLALLKKFERGPNHLGRLVENAGRYLGIHELLLLLGSELNHGISKSTRELVQANVVFLKGYHPRQATSKDSETSSDSRRLTGLLPYLN